MPSEDRYPILLICTHAPGFRLPTHSSVRQSSQTLPLRSEGVQSNLLDDLTEEAEQSWLSRFLPKKGPGKQQPARAQNAISELPIMFTKGDDTDDPAFDYDRWVIHRSSSRYGRLVLGILFGTSASAGLGTHDP